MENNSIAEKDTYCSYIDGLRGIAILMVIAVHSAILCSQLQPEYYHIHYVKRLLASGARGVQLFFILSAFTLVHSSMKRFRTDPYPRLSFYIRRAFRILPFWWLAVAYYGWSKKVAIASALPSIFFFFGFVRYDAAKEIVPGGWSLFVEETFYLLLPFVLYFASGIKRALQLFVLTAAIAIAWVMLAPRLGVPTTNSFVGLSPLTNWFCFALGILAYQLLKYPNRFMQFYDSLSKPIVIDSFAMLVMIFAIANIFTAPFALFGLVCISSRPRGLFGRIMRQGMLIRYGRYCYSIYLIHFALLTALKPGVIYVFRTYIHSTISMEARFVLVFSVVVPLAGVIGSLSFNLIERPCVRLGKRLIEQMNVWRSTERRVFST